MQTLPQLLCLPPAGAGPSIYHFWAGRFRDRLDVQPIALPGRETRLAELPPSSLDALADQLADELAPKLSRRYALFGYSMGAVLAYEMARRWLRRGLPQPEFFFIIACNPPDRLLADREPLHLMESTAFWQSVMEIGGTPREIFESTEARILFEPILRNDFRICETYRHRPDDSRFTCPTHAFAPDEDHMTDAATMEGWRNFVGDQFSVHPIPGKHMMDRTAFEVFPQTLLDLWPIV